MMARLSLRSLLGGSAALGRVPGAARRRDRTRPPARARWRELGRPGTIESTSATDAAPEPHAASRERDLMTHAPAVPARRRSRAPDRAAAARRGRRLASIPRRVVAYVIAAAIAIGVGIVAAVIGSRSRLAGGRGCPRRWVDDPGLVRDRPVLLAWFLVYSFLQGARRRPSACASWVCVSCAPTAGAARIRARAAAQRRVRARAVDRRRLLHAAVRRLRPVPGLARPRRRRTGASTSRGFGRLPRRPRRHSAPAAPAPASPATPSLRPRPMHPRRRTPHRARCGKRMPPPAPLPHAPQPHRPRRASLRTLRRRRQLPSSSTPIRIDAHGDLRGRAARRARRRRQRRAMITVVPGISPSVPAPASVRRCAPGCPRPRSTVRARRAVVQPLDDEDDPEDTRISIPGHRLLVRLGRRRPRDRVGAHAVRPQSRRAEDGAAVVVVRDETLSLSKTHFEAGGRVLRRLGDGPALHQRHDDRARRRADRCPPGERVRIRLGDAIEIGDRIVTVAATHDAGRSSRGRARPRTPGCAARSTRTALPRAAPRCSSSPTAWAGTRPARWPAPR